MITEVTTTYLEMHSRDELKPKHTSLPVEIKQIEIPLPEFNRFLYAVVGRDWYWYDRLEWNYAQWQEWVERPELQTWVLYLQGTPAGYFELEKQGELERQRELERQSELERQGELEKQKADVNIAYFGLLPQFIGKGLGGYFLSIAVERAWAFGAKRVTLNTCTLDHESALKNYQARGFKVYKQKTESRTLPDTKPELWAGAGEISQ